MVSEWREEKAKMEKEVNSLESRAQEQTKKNDLLHKQLNQLNEQVKGRDPHSFKGWFISRFTGVAYKKGNISYW